MAGGRLSTHAFLEAACPLSGACGTGLANVALLFLRSDLCGDHHCPFRPDPKQRHPGSAAITGSRYGGRYPAAAPSAALRIIMEQRGVAGLFASDTKEFLRLGGWLLGSVCSPPSRSPWNTRLQIRSLWAKTPKLCFAFALPKFLNRLLRCSLHTGPSTTHGQSNLCKGPFGGSWCVVAFAFAETRQLWPLTPTWHQAEMTAGRFTHKDKQLGAWTPSTTTQPVDSLRHGIGQPKPAVQLGSRRPGVICLYTAFASCAM